MNCGSTGSTQCFIYARDRPITYSQELSDISTVLQDEHEVPLGELRVRIPLEITITDRLMNEAWKLVYLP
jgi:hypothetical protein